MGNQMIAVRHFTNEITNIPFIMDSNCFMVFSHLWRRYDSSSVNEHLITKDGWFQYTMKSLMSNCGFGDKGTLQRAVEGLYRSKVIDVRAESGSRMWACWKMNKAMIERIASIPNADAMQEPYLNSICAISSKDGNYTYLGNKEGIDDLKCYFGVQAVENPPLFNTITQQHHNTTKQQNYNTVKQQNSNTSPLHNSNTILDIEKRVNSNKFKEEFEVVTEGVEENQNESKSQIERNEDSNPYQPKENSLLTPRENKEIAKAFRALEFFKPSIDTNTLNTCLDLLHEVSQSNRNNYMSLLTKAHHSFNELLKDYTKEERKAFFKALNDLSRVLGDAFHRYDTKQK
jgi:hypothetical protein